MSCGSQNESSHQCRLQPLCMQNPVAIVCLVEPGVMLYSPVAVSGSPLWVPSRSTAVRYSCGHGWGLNPVLPVLGLLCLYNPDRAVCRAPPLLHLSAHREKSRPGPLS